MVKSLMSMGRLPSVVGSGSNRRRAPGEFQGYVTDWAGTSYAGAVHLSGRGLGSGWFWTLQRVW